MRINLILLLSLLIGCSKPESSPKEYTKTTYTNYQGYWDYCRFGSNEINPELKFVKSEKIFLFEHEVITDTTICKGLNCPRNGQMTYQIRTTIE